MCIRPFFGLLLLLYQCKHLIMVANVCVFYRYFLYVFLRLFVHFFLFLFIQHFVDRVTKIRAAWYKNHEISFVVSLSFIIIVLVFESFLFDNSNCFFLRRISSISYISNTIPTNKSKKGSLRQGWKVKFSMYIEESFK